MATLSPGGFIRRGDPRIWKPPECRACRPTPSVLGTRLVFIPDTNVASELMRPSPQGWLRKA